MELLSVQQVAERLGKDRTTVHRYVTEGHLPVAHKLPGVTGARLFDPVDVAALEVMLAERASA